jgi:hypothetical protein
VQVVGVGVSKAGRPRLPMRLMISLLYLKHAFNESDEAVVERWGETPIWQFFSGMDYYEHRRGCDPTALVKFRRLLGEAGVEELLAQTVNAAVSLKLIERKHLSNVIVDSTVAPEGGGVSDRQPAAGDGAGKAGGGGQGAGHRAEADLRQGGGVPALQGGADDSCERPAGLFAPASRHGGDSGMRQTTPVCRSETRPDAAES